MKNIIVCVAILLFMTASWASAQNPQLCYNSNGNYYYDCSQPTENIRSRNKVSGNGSSVNNITVYASGNSTVIVNNQNNTSPRPQVRTSNRSNPSLCYDQSGNYYYNCENSYQDRSYREYPNTSRYVRQRQGFVPLGSQPVYPSGYYPVTPTGNLPQYYANQPVYYNKPYGYYGNQVPTPYWHDQKSTTVTHDIQTNIGNSGGWWGYGGFNPRNIGVNYRVRIQQNKTSVRGSSVNGQVPYIYNTGVFGWP